MEPTIASSKSPFLKIAIVLVVAALLGVGIYFILNRSVKEPVSYASPSAQKPILESGARVDLLTKTPSVTVGSNVLVEIKLNTGGRETDGTDIVLKYNPSLLEATNSAITTGTIYDEYPLVKVDPTSSEIRISGMIVGEGAGFSGIGSFATVNFKALSKGTAKLEIVSAEGDTADSNVVQTKGKDILTEVYGLEIEIK